VTEAVDIVQCSCDVFGVHCVDSNNRYIAMVLCCVGFYCGYSNSRYSAMILYCVWSFLWLQQQKK